MTTILLIIFAAFIVFLIVHILMKDSHGGFIDSFLDFFILQQLFELLGEILKAIVESLHSGDS